LIAQKGADYVEVGPFDADEAQSICEMFESKGVQFEILVDNDEENEIRREHQKKMDEYTQESLQNFNQRGFVTTRKAPVLDLRTIYFEIADSDYSRVQDFLEKYGFGLPTSDGSYELGDE
jgi:predicted PolB exonuclease-like 3'-5' exonuclease